MLLEAGGPVLAMEGGMNEGTYLLPGFLETAAATKRGSSALCDKGRRQDMTSYCCMLEQPCMRLQPRAGEAGLGGMSCTQRASRQGAMWTSEQVLLHKLNML